MIMRKHFKTFVFAALTCSLLLGAGLSAEAASKVAINETNFSMSLLREAQEADKNGDGYLSKKEASRITDIQLFSAEKNDPFKGIEHFSNLKDFDYTAQAGQNGDDPEPDNNAASVKHRLDLSNFKKLENVTINCNTLYLKEIDLEGCSSLRDVDITCRGSVDSLNLKGCKNLREFTCMNTSAKKINLSNFKKLTRVAITIHPDDGSGNDHGYLKTLNLKNCSNLTYVGCSGVRTIKLKGADKLQKLDCSYANLSSLDVSGKKQLQTIKCNDNPSLTQLDVSGCQNLRNLRCYNTGLTKLNVKQNTRLVRLLCSNTNIKKLNLKNNKKLWLLDCRDTNIRSLNLSKALKNKEVKIRCEREVPITYKAK